MAHREPVNDVRSLDCAPLLNNGDRAGARWQLGMRLEEFSHLCFMLRHDRNSVSPRFPVVVHELTVNPNAGDSISRLPELLGEGGCQKITVVNS